MDNHQKIEQLKGAIYPIFWDNGSYSFLHLEINLKDTASKDALEKEKEEASCFVTLVHEYIHYIQNFTTTWGFTNFITYIDLFAVFFGDNILLDKDPILPLHGGIVDNKFGRKNYLNYLKSSFLGITKGSDGRIIFDKTLANDFDIIESTITDPYWSKEVYISYIAFNGQKIPVNELVLSENMAIVSSYLASGLSLDESKKSIDKLWGHEYHIVYSYLHNLFPDKDTLKMTYYLCESALLIVPYNKRITQMLIYIRDNISDFKNKSENEIIQALLEHIEFKKSLEKIIPEILRQVESRIHTFSKYKENYEFYKYLLDVLDIFKRGMEERLKNNHTYRDNFNSEFLNYYSKILHSPILVFADKQKTMLGEPSEKFVNSMAYFSGVLKIFHTAYFRNISKCPFCEEYSICQVVKGTECETNALSVYGDEKYNGCIMQNSLNIIGIRKEGR